MNRKNIVPVIFIVLTACAPGTQFVKPAVTELPQNFKEMDIHWKTVDPGKVIEQSSWWKMFNDPFLDKLEEKLNDNNQSLAAAAAGYQEALALVDKARAGYFPDIGGSAALNRAKETSSSQTGSHSTTTRMSATRSLQLSASWEPDLWGSVRYSVESGQASAQASHAALAMTRLSLQASLAQYYFELRTVTQGQKLLDQITQAYQGILAYTQNRYSAGVMAQADVVQAEIQLQTAQAAAISNQTNLKQYEHAIAVLLGESPSSFSLSDLPAERDIKLTIPVGIPSQLLESRPDIAQAERLVAQANAQVGLAKTAFFPDLTLSAANTLEGSGLKNLLSLPVFLWSVGAQLTANLFNGGAELATLKASQANYNATIAAYRQTVLSAFQDVEDNLAALNTLEKRLAILDLASANNQTALRYVNNEYQVGVADYAKVLEAQIAAYTATKTALDVKGLTRTTQVTLIKALGGGWSEAEAPLPEK